MDGSFLPNLLLGKPGRKSRRVYKIVGLLHIEYTNESAPRRWPTGPHERQARVQEKLRRRVQANNKAGSLIFTEPSAKQARAQVTSRV